MTDLAEWARRALEAAPIHAPVKYQAVVTEHCASLLAALDEHGVSTFTDANLDIINSKVCTSCFARMDYPDAWGGDDRGWPYPLVQVPYPCRTVRLIAWGLRHSAPDYPGPQEKP